MSKAFVSDLLCAALSFASQGSATTSFARPLAKAWLPSGLFTASAGQEMLSWEPKTVDVHWVVFLLSNGSVMI